MPLKKYNQKRNFKNTPEPKGEINSKSKILNSKLKFVIQKHQATALHYDLRLENDGVMKSWAVPKGLTLDPSIKHLAMEVEDHPIDYNDFEGIIPEGNYGAGTVMIWDEGYYEPLIVHEGENQEQAVTRHLKDGHLKFRLFGKKLHGEFALVRIKNKGEGEDQGKGEGKRKGKNKSQPWLIIKHKDEAANTAIPGQDFSVRSGRTMKEITSNAKPKAENLKTKFDSQESSIQHPESEEADESSYAEATEDKPTKTKMPKEVIPMLATLTNGPFQNEDWLYELKWDGYRALGQIEDGKVRLYSRNNITFNDDFPEIVEELQKLKGKMLLDGEVVAVDENGVSKFQLLQTMRQHRYDQGFKQKLLYYVFDILYFDQFDLRSLSFEKRQEILKQVLKPNKTIRLSETFANGEDLFKSSKKIGMEGIIAKKKSSKYSEARSNDWLKIKSVNEREFVIGGYTKPKGNRKDFGSILIGEYDKDKFIYRGHVGTGFDSQNMPELKAMMDKLELKKSPFIDVVDAKATTAIPERNNVAKWISPKIVIQVKFTEWTDENLLRHPVYLGLRKDKLAREVISEPKIKVKDEVKDKNKLAHRSLGVDEVEFSHLEKIYWPEDKYTKKDLIEYYNNIGDTMLLYLVDRAENMNRHPNGIEGENFFHKDFNTEHPDFVKTEKIHSESNDKDINYLLCQNKETLLYMANLGCIEINPWNSRISNLENPDYVLFDLDPVEVKFSELVKVAQKVHEICEELKIPNFCKTSGKRGLHIYVPLQAKYNFDQVKLFAELIAVKVQNELPKLASLERSPQDRKGKVYIDYLQNRKGQTTCAPYSVRPVKGATVSTPLNWEEVDSKLDPKKFTIKTMPERLEKVGDLWKGVLGEGIDIGKVIKVLSTKF